jgi:hypothetical protein
MANGSRAHDCADCLGYSALLADYSAHIVGRDVQMKNDYAIGVGLVLFNFNRALVLDKLADDCV